jgi:low affinity Fe/Cu permease
MWFSTIAHWTAEQFGRAYTFIAATFLVILWLVTGPYFGYSETWQLVINTATTIITFLAVFLLQHTQMHDTQAMQAKLDELIRATAKASNEVIQIEEKTEEEVRKLRERQKPQFTPKKNRWTRYGPDRGQPRDA